MSTMELNAELFHQLSYLADDETYMQKVLKFICELVAQKAQLESDEYISKDEILAGIGNGLQEVKECDFATAKTLQDVIDEL